MSKGLQISESLALPLDTVTDTLGVLAIKGAGKTHTTMVLAEEMAKQNIPIVVFDVVGVCWGLRLAANGKDDGLPFIIFGGPHGDVPLAPSAGKVIADFVVAERPLVVFDLSGFETKAEQNRFIKDFCVRIYQTNRDPIHLIMDEADDYLPQRPMGDDAFTLRAVEVLVRRGRARGIGVTLVTQRSAAINKGVLTQVSSLILGRTISPQDRAAVKLWVDAHGTDSEKTDFWASIVVLPTKEKWVWAPMRNVFARAKIRARETYDSSFTPKLGDKRTEPKKLGPVDLDAIRSRIATTLEQHKSDDPRELRKKIAELEKQLRAKPAPAAPETIAVAVFSEVDIGRIEAAARAMADVAKVAAGACDGLMNALAKAKATAAHRPEPALRGLTAPPPVVRERVHTVNRGRVSTKVVSSEGGIVIGKCARAILSVLATHGTRNQDQIAILSGYRQSGGYRNALGALRSGGLIEGGGDAISITDAGVAAAGEIEPLPRGRALVEYWLANAGGKCHRAILETLVDVHPRAMSQEAVAEATGYQVSGGFRNAIGRLRSLHLVTPRGDLALTETLGEAARA